MLGLRNLWQHDAGNQQTKGRFHVGLLPGKEREDNFLSPFQEANHLSFAVLPISSGMGYQKKAILLEPVVKTCQKGNLRAWVVVLSNFCVLESAFHRLFSRIEYHLKAKVLEPGKKFFLVCTLHANLGHVPFSNIQVPKLSAKGERKEENDLQCNVLTLSDQGQLFHMRLFDKILVTAWTMLYFCVAYVIIEITILTHNFVFSCTALQKMLAAGTIPSLFSAHTIIQTVQTALRVCAPSQRYVLFHTASQYLGEV